MKTIIEMAREAGLYTKCEVHSAVPFDQLLEAFAALVRAEAQAEEREACAKVCDDWPNGRDDVYLIGVAIRARGNT